MLLPLSQLVLHAAATLRDRHRMSREPGGRQFFHPAVVFWELPDRSRNLVISRSRLNKIIMYILVLVIPEFQAFAHFAQLLGPL